MKTKEVITFDEKKAEQFSEKLLGFINGGTLALMLSIGHRTGLFDVLREMPPATVREIAGKTKLNERYIKEWLAAMVSGGIMEYDELTKQYFFPPEHAAFLTRAAGADNIGVFSQYIGVLGSVEDEIVNCFHNGGGVPYEKFHRFHDIMAEDSGQSVISALFDHILPLAPGLHEKLEKGISVLDIGCGSGRAMNLLAEAYPSSNFTGLDLCEEPVMKARDEANRRGNTNIWFDVADLTYYEPDNQYDLITAFDAIHDQARPDKVLSTVYKSLKDDGLFLMQDIDASSDLQKNTEHPLGAMLYTVSTMHCMTVSLAQGGMGLGTMWGVETAQKMLKEAGFKTIDIRRLKHDIQNCYFLVKK